MLDFRESWIKLAFRKVLVRFHFPLKLMHTCVHWYVAYPLRLRDVEEMFAKSAAYSLTTSTVHRWATKMLPALAAVFRRRKRPVGLSWRMDETYIKLTGQLKYLYRAVDRDGDTVDFLLTAKRDMTAWRFLELAINLHNVPEKISVDKSGANTAAIESVKADACVDILIRQSKYINNIARPDHRAIKRVTRLMLGFKSFWSARIQIEGIETMHMIRKGQMGCPEGSSMPLAYHFCSLAA